MSGCTSNCDTCGVSDCSSRQGTPVDFSVKLADGCSVKKVVGIVSGKGGVGKSLVTSLLASASMREGFKTAVLDGDITGPSIPQAFGIHENLVGSPDGLIVPATTSLGIDLVSVNLMLANETDPVIWRGPVLGGVIKQFWGETLWNNIDYMFIDMPPGTGDIPLTVYQMFPIDGVVIASSPQSLVSMIVEKSINMATKMGIKIVGLVENMSYVECPNCKEKIKIFGESKIDDICKKNNIKLLAQVPLRADYSSFIDSGKVEDLEVPEFNNVIEEIKKL